MQDPTRIGKRLDGKVAIITGAGNGQGAEEARAFAAEGAWVAVCDVAFDRAQTVAASIIEDGGHARAYDLDVRNADAWAATVEDVRAWSGREVGILVNNAGIILRTRTFETSLENWQRVLDINLTGAFLGTKAVAPSMKRGGGGAIINISSVAGLSGYYDVAYSSSKWALRGLTRSTALEFAEAGIRVNAICPGVIVTGLNESAPHLEPFRRMIPMHRTGNLAEVTALALFLASDESSYITGEDIALDGGLTAGAAMHRIIAETEEAVRG